MKLPVLRIFVANIFLFQIVSSSLLELEERKLGGLKPYDILVLSQSWPQTTCWSLNDKWSDQTCNPCNYAPRSSDNSWTLHGLWPSNRNGKHPRNCDKSKVFNEKLLGRDLETKMQDKWATFNLKSSNKLFWKHEWTKHGTCAADVASLNSIPKYFSKAVDMLNAYNMGKILKRFGITPKSNAQYRVEDVARAMESTFQRHVNIICAENKINKKSYLDEIQICFDKSFKLVHCNLSSNQIKCNGKTVVYPELLKPCK